MPELSEAEKAAKAAAEAANGGAGDGSNNNGGDGGSNNNSGQNGQGNQGGGQGGGSEETVTLKKSEHDKLVSDLNNYKTGLINRKAGDRSGGEGGEGGQGSGDKPLDQKKVEEISTAAASKVLSQKATKDANKQFLSGHAEYLDDKQWQELLTHYHPKRGTLAPEDILEDFEDAVLAHKRSSGQLETYLNDQAEKRRKLAEANAAAEAGREAGSNGQRTSGGGTGGATLTPDGQAMAQRFGHDPKKVAEVKPEDRTINIIKQK